MGCKERLLSEMHRLLLVQEDESFSHKEGNFTNHVSQEDKIAHV